MQRQEANHTQPGIVQRTVTDGRPQAYQGETALDVIEAVINSIPLTLTELHQAVEEVLTDVMGYREDGTFGALPEYVPQFETVTEWVQGPNGPVPIESQVPVIVEVEVDSPELWQRLSLAAGAENDGVTIVRGIHEGAQYASTNRYFDFTFNNPVQGDRQYHVLVIRQQNGSYTFVDIV